MELNLKDKVVIITGGSKGIGAGCVEIFAQEGAIPVIVGRSPEVGQALIEKCGVGHVIQAELTSEEECKSAIEQTLAIRPHPLCIRRSERSERIYHQHFI